MADCENCSGTGDICDTCSMDPDACECENGELIECADCNGMGVVGSDEDDA